MARATKITARLVIGATIAIVGLTSTSGSVTGQSRYRPGGLTGIGRPGGFSGIERVGGLTGIERPGGLSGIERPGGLSGIDRLGGLSGIDRLGGLSGIDRLGGLSGIDPPIKLDAVIDPGKSLAAPPAAAPSAPPASPVQAPVPRQQSSAREKRLYRWIDGQGEVHLTDSLDAIPKKFRGNSGGRGGGRGGSITPPPSPPPMPPGREGGRTGGGRSAAAAVMTPPPPPPRVWPRAVLVAPCAARPDTRPDCSEVMQRDLLKDLLRDVAQLKLEEGKPLDSVSREAHQELLQAMDLAHSSEFPSARRVLRRIYEAPRSSRAHSLIQAQALLIEADILYYGERRVEDALVKYKDVLNRALHPALNAWAAGRLGFVGYMAGVMSLPQTESYFAQARSQLAAVEDAELRATILLSIASVYMDAGRPSVANGLLKEVRSRCAARACKKETVEEIEEYSALWKVSEATGAPAAAAPNRQVERPAAPRAKAAVAEGDGARHLGAPVPRLTSMLMPSSDPFRAGGTLEILSTVPSVDGDIPRASRELTMWEQFATSLEGAIRHGA